MTKLSKYAAVNPMFSKNEEIISTIWSYPKGQKKAAQDV
jgi:hypothetical protein